MDDIKVEVNKVGMDAELYRRYLHMKITEIAFCIDEYINNCSCEVLADEEANALVIGAQGALCAVKDLLLGGIEKEAPETVEAFILSTPEERAKWIVDSAATAYNHFISGEDE